MQVAAFIVVVDPSKSSVDRKAGGQRSEEEQNINKVLEILPQKAYQLQEGKWWLYNKETQQKWT